MSRKPGIPKTEKRGRKRLDSVSSQLYGFLIGAGERGSTPEELAEWAPCSARRARSHLSVLVTEGLAENIGRHVWTAIIPARQVWAA